MLYCDASGIAGGACLFTGNPEIKENFKPIMFLSRKFSKQQRNLYSALELEICNILDTLHRLRYLIDFSSSQKSIFANFKVTISVLELKFKYNFFRVIADLHLLG